MGPTNFLIDAPEGGHYANLYAPDGSLPRSGGAVAFAAALTAPAP